MHKLLIPVEKFVWWLSKTFRSDRLWDLHFALWKAAHPADYRGMRERHERIRSQMRKAKIR